jgi:formylglycine-generating enzyme required for sulfatase activity
MSNERRYRARAFGAFVSVVGGAAMGVFGDTLSTSTAWRRNTLIGSLAFLALLGAISLLRRRRGGSFALSSIVVASSVWAAAAAVFYFKPAAEPDAASAKVEEPTGRLSITTNAAPACFECRLEGRRDGRIWAIDIASPGTRQMNIPLGTYDLVGKAAGHEEFRMKVDVVAAQTYEIDAQFRSRLSRLFVFSIPSGAAVLIDDQPKGMTPLEVDLTPESHSIQIRVDEYEDYKSSFVTSPGTPLTIGPIVLNAWPRVELSHLPSDTRATFLHGHRQLRDLDRVPPGRVNLLLERAGYVTQTAEFTAVVGETTRVPVQEWVRRTGWLSLRRLPRDAIARLTDSSERLAEGTAVPAGRRVVVLERTGFETQNLDVDVPPDVTVELAPRQWVAVPRPNEPRPRGPVVSGNPLSSLAAWSASSAEARLAAAQALLDGLDGWSIVGLEECTAGEISRSVAIARHRLTELEFSIVPAGGCWVGSRPREPGRRADETRRYVEIERPFLVSRTEVTNQAWQRVMDNSRAPDPSLPVNRVSWVQAQEFCQRAGLTLPSEAQWEYAARAGSEAAFSFGDDGASIGDYAWGSMNMSPSANRPRSVRLKQANAFGMFDVHGNVAEWCSDIYSDSPAAPQSNPGNQNSNLRVFRGGSYMNGALSLRCAARSAGDAAAGQPYLGFRVIWERPQ